MESVDIKDLLDREPFLWFRISVVVPFGIPILA